MHRLLLAVALLSAKRFAVANAGVLCVASMAAAQSDGGGMGMGGGNGMARWGPWHVSRGDPAAGKAMVAQVCAACHGEDGNSIQPLYPRLAGQKESYLYTQLRNFASGQRKNDIMAGMVAALDDKAMQDVSAYFSRQQAKRPGIAGKATSIAVGRRLYDQGDANRQIPACVNCHTAGQDLGRRVAFPLLAGQRPEYVAAQIRAMRDGTRDHALMMPMIAARLSEKEIDALATYVGGVR
jgi:cytochrome c553